MGEQFNLNFDFNGVPMRVHSLPFVWLSLMRPDVYQSAMSQLMGRDLDTADNLQIDLNITAELTSTSIRSLIYFNDY